jgi:hypothetical protein
MRLSRAVIENLNSNLYKLRYNTYRYLLNTNRTEFKYQFYTFFTRSLFLHSYIYLTPYAIQTNHTSIYTKLYTKTTRRNAIRAGLDKQLPSTILNFFYTRSDVVSYIYQNSFTFYIKNLVLKSFSFGFSYIQGFTFLLFIDACLTDDEPLWEPIEWSLVQTWILFIFLFAWVAENLIVSRYGSYTGRDKRVWMAWYKTFWLIEGFYVLNYGVVVLFVIVPFYYELNYNVSFIYSWWHWYSRIFFFKFISVFSLAFLVSFLLQINIRWLNWKQGLYLIILINIFLAYLLYTHFIMTFFGYFADPIWYQKTRPIDYIQLSHEPAKWGWGSAKKDHFTYHGVKTVLWFKNDGPFATSFLFFQTFLFVCIFLLYMYWVVLFRRVYSMKELPITLTTYCASSLKQFFYFFLYFYIFIFASYLANYWRLPIEFFWVIETHSWTLNFFSILSEYPNFILSILV